MGWKKRLLFRDRDYNAVEWLSPNFAPLNVSELRLSKRRARPHLQPCPQNFKLEQEEENVPDQEQNSSIETPSEEAASPHS